MARLTLAEQTRLAKLLVDRSCRAASARLKQSPLLKWRYGPPVADRLLLVPVELRAADPSFAGEIDFGHYGLDGALAVLEDDQSPFEIAAPTVAWARELHGFSWLRHLHAAGNAGARDSAIALVTDWCRRNPQPATGIAWEPVVVARRLMSWLANAPLILDGVEPAVYDIMADALADHLIHLSATWPDAPQGEPRLVALAAVLMGNLCVAGHDRNLAAAAQAFSAELDLQILPDGGHVSRNPAVLVTLLLDFLPLRQCFVTRDRPLPAGFDGAVRRMLRMLQYLRLGTGRIAQFNGVSAQAIDALSTVLAYDDKALDPITSAPQSKYVRLERGGVVVLVDAGPPPPLEVSGQAHAGCLSFEMSAKAQALFVNCGAPSPAALEWLPAARATSSHNTVAIGGKSSAKLLQDDRFASLLGGTPLRFPECVGSKVTPRDGGIELDAFHDGYFVRFKLLHRRRIILDAEGASIVGIDRLGPQRGQLRLPIDVPFAIHFHVDEKVDCTVGDVPHSANLKLLDGQRWRFRCEGAALSIEEGMNFSNVGGPRPSLQLVLRAATFGESDVKWTVERML